MLGDQLLADGLDGEVFPFHGAHHQHLVVRQARVVGAPVPQASQAGALMLLSRSRVLKHRPPCAAAQHIHGDRFSVLPAQRTILLGSGLVQLSGFLLPAGTKCLSEGLYDQRGPFLACWHVRLDLPDKCAKPVLSDPQPRECPAAPPCALSSMLRSFSSRIFTRYVYSWSWWALPSYAVLALGGFTLG